MTAPLKKIYSEQLYNNYYQPLFDIMYDNHEVILVESEMQDIIECVDRMKREYVKTMPVEERERLAKHIIDTVITYYQMDIHKLLKKERTTEKVLARQMIAYLIKSMTRMSDEKISDYLNRDRTTIIHAIRKMQGFVKIGDPVEIIQDIEAIKKLL